MPKHLTKEFQDRLAKFDQSFEKDFGSGTLAQDKKIVPYDVLSTGSIALDLATGVGGYVVGRLNEIYGIPDSGKSEMCLLAAAEAQKKWPDRFVAYIDVENKMDNKFAEAHDVDRTQWRLYKPKNAEDVADSMKNFLTEPLFSLVVIDSIGAMIGKVEQEKQAEQDTVAIVARIVTRMIKIANSFAETNKSVVLCVNQLRSNINKYGADTTLPGGWGLKYSTTMQFQVKPTQALPLTVPINGEKIQVGRQVAITLKRNKVAPKGSTAMVTIRNVATPKYGPVGVDLAEEAAQVGIKTRVIKRAGAWYTLPNKERVNGEDGVRSYLAAHPKEIEVIRNLAIKTMDSFDEEDEVVLSDAEIAQDVMDAEEKASLDTVDQETVDQVVDQETGEILLPAPDFNNIWGTQ